MANAVNTDAALQRYFAHHKVCRECQSSLLKPCKLAMSMITQATDAAIAEVGRDEANAYIALCCEQEMTRAMRQRSMN